MAFDWASLRFTQAYERGSCVHPPRGSQLAIRTSTRYYSPKLLVGLAETEHSNTALTESTQVAWPLPIGNSQTKIQGNVRLPCVPRTQMYVGYCLII